MIMAEPDDLGSPVDMETLDWAITRAERRTGPTGKPPSVSATLGWPLGWWGRDRPGGDDTDHWMIVRLAASYRADPGSKVEWSRLTVDLPSTRDGNPLIVTDQYPDDVSDDELRDVQLSLSPQFKLMAVSASLGSVSTTVRIAKVTPVISAWGGQENSFGWDLTSTDRYPIIGIRHFFAIIPCSESTLAISLGIDVDARTAGGSLWRGQRSKQSQQRQFDVAMQKWSLRSRWPIMRRSFPTGWYIVQRIFVAR
jgi:hypothetical protein